MFSRIWNAIQGPDVPLDAKIDLQRGLDSLRTAQRVIRDRKHRKNSSKVASTRAEPTSTGVERRCKLCKVALPHVGKAQWSLHMAARRHLGGRRKAWASSRRLNWPSLTIFSPRTRVRRALVRRSAIFAEIAPHAFSKMTSAEVEAAINRCRNPADGTMRCIRNYRTWVRKNFGATGGANRRLTPPPPAVTI